MRHPGSPTLVQASTDLELAFASYLYVRLEDESLHASLRTLRLDVLFIKPAMDYFLRSLLPLAPHMALMIFSSPYRDVFVLVNSRLMLLYLCGKFLCGALLRLTSSSTKALVFELVLLR